MNRSADLTFSDSADSFLDADVVISRARAMYGDTRQEAKLQKWKKTKKLYLQGSQRHGSESPSGSHPAHKPFKTIR